jgi:hypothetical protein
MLQDPELKVNVIVVLTDLRKKKGFYSMLEIFAFIKGISVLSGDRERRMFIRYGFCHIWVPKGREVQYQDIFKRLAGVASVQLNEERHMLGL